MESEKKKFIEKFFNQKFNAFEMIDAKIWEIALVALNRASQISRIAGRADVSDADLHEAFEDILTGEMVDHMDVMSHKFDQEFNAHDSQIELQTSHLEVPAPSESKTLMPQSRVNSQTQPDELAQNVENNDRQRLTYSQEVSRALQAYSDNFIDMDVDDDI